MTSGKLKKILADPVTLNQRQARFAEEPTAHDAYELARFANGASDNVRAVDLYHQVAELDPQLAAEMNVEQDIFWATYGGMVASGTHTATDLEAAAAVVVADPTITLSTLMEVCWQIVKVADEVGLDRAKPYLDRVLEQSEQTDDPELQEFRKRFQVNEALLVQKNPHRAVMLKKELLPAGWQQDMMELYEFGVWCYQKGVNLPEAEMLSRRALEFAQDDERQAECHNLLGSILHKQGMFEQAVAELSLAVKFNPEESWYTEKLARYEKEIDTTR